MVGSGQQRAEPSLPCDLGAQEKTGPGWTRAFGVRYVAEAQDLLKSFSGGEALICAGRLGPGAQAGGVGPLSCGGEGETLGI